MEVTRKQRKELKKLIKADLERVFNGQQGQDFYPSDGLFMYDSDLKRYVSDGRGWSLELKYRITVCGSQSCRWGWVKIQDKEKNTELVFNSRGFANFITWQNLVYGSKCILANAALQTEEIKAKAAAEKAFVEEFISNGKLK